VVLLVFAVGMVFLFMYVSSERARREKQAEDGQSPATQAASKPATQAASKPAAATEPPPAAEPKPVTKKPPATRPARPEWTAMPMRLEDKPIVIGSLDAKEGYLFQIELVNRGAAVRNAKLTTYFETVADKQLYAEDPDKYEEARLKDPKKYKGHYKMLGAVFEGDRLRYALATHRLRVAGLPGETQELTIALENRHWNLQPGSTRQSASFEWELHRDLNYDKPGADGQYVPYLRIVKTYTIAKNDYSIAVSIKIENLAKEATLSVSLDQFGPTPLEPEAERSGDVRTAVGYLKAGGENVEVDLKHPNERLGKENTPPYEVEVGTAQGDRPTVWIGTTNRFFASLMYVRPTDEKQLQAKGPEPRFYFTWPKDRWGVIAAVSFHWPKGSEGGRSLAPGDEMVVNLDVFTGPKKRTVLTSESPLPAKPLYARLGYKNTIEMRSCCWAGSIAWYMMWLLEQLSRISLGNYGVAIILLVVLVRLVLHPLTKKGQVQMVKMQKLAPQMQKLKEKYKDDKQALNREMMALYKQAGATPLLGCLPMLLQLPILFALFAGLNAAVELRHAAFLPFWITDLAAPDALVSFGEGVKVPMLGWTLRSFNLLPILVTLSMFLYTKTNPQATQPTDPAQAKQTKMMTYMMPVMMLFFFYSAPSGLNLYFMTSTFAGVAEQKIIRKHIQAKEAAQAATETKVEVPGKGPRAGRPKKPKGPFWFKQG